MGKKFKLTEAQRDALLAEGVKIQGETDSTGKADINQTSRNITNSGIDPKKVSVEFSGSAVAGGSSITEHRIVTKKDLQKNRLRYLKENSELVSFNNFMKKLQ